jgi:hypothetical protein
MRWCVRRGRPAAGGHQPSADRHAASRIRVRPITQYRGSWGLRVTLENPDASVESRQRVERRLARRQDAPGFERNSVGSPRQCQLALGVRTGREGDGDFDDPLFESRLTEIWLEVADLASLFERFVQAVRNGATPGAEVSVMKTWATETLQRLTELLIEVAGESGAISGAQAFDDAMLDIVMPFLDARSVTISAGSSQVQRNIIAKRVLNL